MQRVSLHFKNKSILKCLSARPLLLGFKRSLPIEKNLSTAALERDSRVIFDKYRVSIKF